MHVLLYCSFLENYLLPLFSLRKDKNRYDLLLCRPSRPTVDKGKCNLKYKAPQLDVLLQTTTSLGKSGGWVRRRQDKDPRDSNFGWLIHFKNSILL